MNETITGVSIAVVVIRFLVDAIKSRWKRLGSRGIHVIVASLSFVAGLILAEGNLATLFITAGAIFAGAIAFYEVASVQREKK